jgi:DNA-binding transcriptional MerR regulator
MTAHRTMFVRRARRVGFSPAEIDDLWSARLLEGSCEAVQGMLQAKRRELRKRMAALEAKDMTLTALLVECWKHQTSGPCPVRWDFRFGSNKGAGATLDRSK